MASLVPLPVTILTSGIVSNESPSTVDDPEPRLLPLLLFIAVQLQLAPGLGLNCCVLRGVMSAVCELAVDLIDISYLDA